MRKLKYLLESKLVYQDIEDNLLSLVEDGFLSLSRKPSLINDYGNSGNDYNPIIIVKYELNNGKIESIEDLNKYWNNLKSLSTSLNRSGNKFKLSNRNLIIYFSIPDNLSELLKDIADIKKEKKYGCPFVYKTKDKIVNFELEFYIDEDFDIFIDVKGLSWDDIRKLNENKSLSKELIKDFENKYNFKFLTHYKEDRSLEPYGNVRHWKFKV